MNFNIAFPLALDGLTNGAVYALIALSLVLTFSVTRVILVQAGEFVSFGALTLYTLQQDRVPMTLWFMLAACVSAGVIEMIRLARTDAAAIDYLRPATAWIAAPAITVGATLLIPTGSAPLLLQAALALAITVPMGAATYRLVYQPVADASILVLLIISVACHFVMDGLALSAFGPDGARTNALSDIQFDIAGQSIALQNLIVIFVSVILAGALYWLTRHTIPGKALRATAINRRGAALVGISPNMAGLTSFTLTAFICATSGILVAPFITIFYNSGFLISLKSFIGATVGAMLSFPLAAAGAIGIGVFESFVAYWTSAYKDALVFALMVPILLGCSLLAKPIPDDEHERNENLHGSRLLATLRRTMERIPPRIAGAGALLFLLLVPVALSHYYVTLVSYVCLSTIVCFGVVLLTGVAGQVSFGQAAFVGIGAYTSGFLSTSCLGTYFLDSGQSLLTQRACSLSPWLSLPASLAITTFCAWLLGAVTLRMRGHFLPIATIAWAVSIFYIFSNTDAIGAASGMTDLPMIPLFPASPINYEFRVYYLIVAFTVLLGWMTRNLLDSQTGRAIRALKNRALMAESIGVNVSLLKIKVFVFAALYAGISGWLYAHMQRFINPSSFSLDVGSQYVFMAVVGGVEQVAGAALGAGVVRLVQDFIQSILRTEYLANVGNIQPVIFGVVIIILLQRTRHGIAFLFDNLRKPIDLPGQRNALPSPNRPVNPGDTPLLRVSNLTKRFGGLVAVSGVNFELHEGEIVALIGPNGAGKSTIFNLISGVLRPCAGVIQFGGQRIDGLSSTLIARAGASRTFQHVKLLPEVSVLENAALGAYRHGASGILATSIRLDRKDETAAREAAFAALIRVGLADEAQQNAGALPLGKQRILEIARALTSRPRLLLLDEPAAGLRSAEKRELSRLLRTLREEGVAILLVEHDMAFVMGLADRVIVQNFGQTLATGTPAQIRTNEHVVAAYLGTAT